MKKKKQTQRAVEICPVCGNNTHYSEGCEICLTCGWSACDN